MKSVLRHGHILIEYFYESLVVVSPHNIECYFSGNTTTNTLMICSSAIILLLLRILGPNVFNRFESCRRPDLLASVFIDPDTVPI